MVSLAARFTASEWIVTLSGASSHHERKAPGTEEKWHQPYISKAADHEAADT